MRPLPAKRRHTSIDVSLAIVNIVLLLIFFFLVSGQIAVERREVGPRPPQSRTLPLDQLPRPVLSVAPGGEWRLDGQPVAPDLLGVALAGVDPATPVSLFIDRAAPAALLVAVLNHPDLRDRGLRLVTLRGGAVP